MDTKMDEYLGNITYENLTRENVHLYIRKDKDNYACLLDCLCLVLLREPYEYVKVQTKLIEKIQVEYRNFEDDIGVPALQCSDLLDTLIQLLEEKPFSDCIGTRMSLFII